MKEAPLSVCEQTFVKQAIKHNQRLDGRKNDEFREIKINFGTEWGAVLVSLGKTKVLAQVSCQLDVPKAARPNEGAMQINVEIGPMAAPHFDAGRNSDLTVQINRTLERTFKESCCVDLESLCVTAEERVWILRVDLNVMNHEGNLIDCCSIATLCALAHFRIPDVSVVEDDVHIHTAAEKEMIPMVLHHYPVCVSYCTFDEGRIAVGDPTAIEERSAESLLVYGLNSFHELCCLNLTGTSLTSVNLLLQCAHRAAARAKLIVDIVKHALEEDKEARATGKNVGFAECLRLRKMTPSAEDNLPLRLRNFSFGINELNRQMTIQEQAEGVDSKAGITASTSVSNTDNIKWIPERDDEDDNIDDLDSDNVASEDEDAVDMKNME